MTVFIGGKQKWVPRPPLIDGLPVKEFLARNADPIWLHETAFVKTCFRANRLELG